MSNGNVSQALGYARAVFELALENWQSNLQLVAAKLNQDPQLLEQLNNTQTSFSDRQKQLDALLPESSSEQVRNFFYTLLKEGHLNLLGNIDSSLARLATMGSNVQIATITTAIPLNDDEQAQFRAKLSAKYGDNLEFEFRIDEKIIGGVVVQVGDKILDGSVAAKLDVARERLMAS